ncbi:uncharacterized protein C8R40DRAFT_141611 [Lentinula edodes]|uniref:uncharacterized protein n=1 Tax=Lentinula edodes TaxID=5353 RepID=UPI001E8D1E65|nr:uncharacterized protein C8R40DRAFT_141611 [Lentinula edodes]KAH7876478.1 hypothetical protein C8R40DRAFT_141611 [Lentinula edodes]
MSFMGLDLFESHGEFRLFTFLVPLTASFWAPALPDIHQSPSHPLHIYAYIRGRAKRCHHPHVSCWLRIEEQRIRKGPCVSGGLNLTYVAIDRPAGNGFSRSQARTTMRTRYNRQGGVEFVKGCHAHSVDSWSSEQWLELSDFCKIFPEYKCTMYDRHTSTNQRPWFCTKGRRIIARMGSATS